MREIEPVQNQIKAHCDTGFQMRSEDIDGCIDQLKATLSPSTVTRYRNSLLAFYDFLPEDKQVYPDTLTTWLESLKGQYSNFQVNLATSAYTMRARRASGSSQRGKPSGRQKDTSKTPRRNNASGGTIRCRRYQNNPS